MQVTMTQGNLEEAIRDFVTKTGLNLPVMEINFTTTRSPTTVVTELILGKMGDTPEATAPVKRAKAAPAKAKSKTTSTVEEVEEEQLELPEDVPETPAVVETVDTVETGGAAEAGESLFG